MKSFYLGCDVSKGYGDFIILDEAEHVVEENFQMDDTYDGHRFLGSILDNLFIKYPEAELFAGLESTGGYENNWLHFLYNLKDKYNIKVARINPLGVNHHKKACLERITTDKMSARNVAVYLIKYSKKVSYNKEDPLADARRQWKYLKMLKKQCAQLLNHLETLMYNAQPQLLTYCKDKTPGWIISLLAKYPTAMKLSRAKLNNLVKIPFITNKKAVELIKNAKTSIASAHSPTMENVISSLAQRIISTRKSIKEQLNILILNYNFPEIEILTSFTGIAELVAFGLMLEIESVQKYPSVKALASFFGLHPVFKESGDGVWGTRMSKRGRKEPRWLLFMAASSAIVNNPWIKELYERYQKNGKSKMSAIGIIMHKILRIIYGMLKNKTMYNPEIDRANRNKIFEKEKTKTITKTRRYQLHDENAPISRRQLKKRKEQEESQNNINHSVRDRHSCR